MCLDAHTHLVRNCAHGPLVHLDKIVSLFMRTPTNYTNNLVNLGVINIPFGINTFRSIKSGRVLERLFSCDIHRLIQLHIGPSKSRKIASNQDTGGMSAPMSMGETSCVCNLPV